LLSPNDGTALLGLAALPLSCSALRHPEAPYSSGNMPENLAFRLVSAGL
jgi:hypothetical protein